MLGACARQRRVRLFSRRMSAVQTPHRAARHRHRHRVDQPRRRGRAARRAVVANALWLAVPGALTVYLAFNAGGFFVGTQGVVAALLAVLLILRVTLAEHPFRGLSVLGGVAIGALALFAVWSLISEGWSHAPARALLEFDRALLYLLALALFSTFPRDPGRIRWLLRGVALGIAVVGGIALVSRLLPHAWPTSTSFLAERLSYPLTYWNALGVLAALGAVFSFHLSADEHEPAVVRILAAAAAPILAATLFFSFSRGGIAVAALGLLIYVLLARPRSLLAGSAAILPTAAISVIACYRADLLAKPALHTAAALSQGRHAALAIGVTAVAAAVLRTLLIPLDAWSSRVQVTARTRFLSGATAALAVLVGLVIAIAAGVPANVAHQYHRFVDGNHVSYAGDVRQRLTDPGNNGRIDIWRVALHGFERHPLDGEGAGTFENRWARTRPNPSSVVHAHSLYLQTMDELGIVGLIFIVIVVGTLLFGLARRAKGRNRALYAVLLANGLAWGLHAGIDWDWEMPALGLWLFALGGAALAARRGHSPRVPSPSRLARLVISLGLLGLAVVPAAIAVSQSRLDSSVQAFNREDCPLAIDRSLGSISVLSSRPEPFEILGYCDSQLGAGRLAAHAFDAAIARDPGNWRLPYGVAIVRGATGLDPRPYATRALHLDPREPLTRQLVKALARARNPRQWGRVAAGASVPVP